MDSAVTTLDKKACQGSVWQPSLQRPGLRLRLRGGVGASVLVATPVSVHSTFIELQLLGLGSGLGLGFHVKSGWIGAWAEAQAGNHNKLISLLAYDARGEVKEALFTTEVRCKG